MYKSSTNRFLQSEIKFRQMLTINLNSKSPTQMEIFQFCPRYLRPSTYEPRHLNQRAKTRNAKQKYTRLSILAFSNYLIGLIGLQYYSVSSLYLRYVLRAFVARERLSMRRYVHHERSGSGESLTSTCLFSYPFFHSNEISPLLDGTFTLSINPLLVANRKFPFSPPPPLLFLLFPFFFFLSSSSLLFRLDFLARVQLLVHVVHVAETFCEACFDVSGGTFDDM